MSNPEQVLYFRLVEALPDNIVIAQTQMSSFLKLAGKQKHWLILSSRIRQKSTDFLILGKDTTPLAAIELQDSTHNKPERMKSDEFKRKALTAAKIPLFEYHVNNMPPVETLRQQITSLENPANDER